MECLVGCLSRSTYVAKGDGSAGTVGRGRGRGVREAGPGAYVGSI